MPDEKDALFGDLAVERGCLTRAQVEEAREARRAMQEQFGVEQSLTQVLLGKKLLTPEQARDIERAVAAATAFVDIDAMPTVLAIPLRAYVEETNPVVKLWHACDVVELTLRLVVSMGLADLRKDGKLPAALLGELRPRIEEPTLGKWKGMALSVAKELSGPGRAVPEIVEFVEEVLVPLLDGPDKARTPATSFSALRNQLAHGGGVTRAAGSRLLETWAPRFEEAVAAGAWLAELAFVVRTGPGTLGVLRGPSPTPAPFAPEDPALRESLETALGCGEGVALVRGAKVLRLWPLASYGLPRSPDPEAPPAHDAVAQMYVRRGEVRLQFTPIGSDEVCQSEGDEAALDEFARLLRLDEAEKEAKAKAFSVRGFEADIRKDAGQLVGRADELERIRKALEETSEGVLWLTGPAGIGKSFLVARIAAELLDEPPGGTLVLPYRFKAGDDRCSRSSFLTFAIERLGRELSADEDDKEAKERRQKKPIDQFTELLGRLGGRRALFILDGLDEIAERDAEFAEDVPLGLNAAGVAWFCAGRPERGLPEAFAPDACTHLFPDGVPPMGGGDIRTMLLEKIGPLRKRLLRGDREDAGQVINPFIRRVAEYAQGLPLYVKYVIGDVLSNRYRALDAGERLPPSLDRYHEELLRRCSVGSLQQVLTPLAATLAVAREPLTAEALTHILLARNLVSEGDARGGLVAKGLGAIASMLRRAATPEGETGYALYHHSLRQHMEESEATRGALETARKALCDLAPGAAHADPAVRSYLLRHGVAHLVEAERWDDVEKVLTDFDFLHAKNELAGPQTLIEDYEAALKAGRFPRGKAADALGLLADALRLSAHVIGGDPTQLAGQILGRVGDFTEPEIARVVERAKEWRGAPWLRPLRPTLTPPGGPMIRTLTGHSDMVKAVAVTPDGRAISGSDDGTVRLWNLDTGACERALEGHELSVMAVATTPDGRAVSGSVELKVWNLETGECERTLEGHSDTVRAVAVTPDSRAVSASYDKTLKVWDLDTGECVRTLEGHSQVVAAVAVTLDGRAVSGSADETLKIWNLGTGECERTLEGHSGSVWAVAVTPDGRTVSGSWDGTLKIWNLETGECERTLEGHSDFVMAVDLMPNGRAVSASADGMLKIWNLETGECERTLEGHSRFFAIAVCPDGRRAATASEFEEALRIWDLSIGEGERMRRQHSARVEAISMTPDGRRVLTAPMFGEPPRVWNLETGECERTLEEDSEGTPACYLVVNLLSVSPDGYAISVSGAALKTWSLETGKRQRTLEVRSRGILLPTPMAVMPDGRVVSDSIGQLNEVAAECERRLEGHSDSVDAVTVAPDYGAVSRSHDNTIKVWDLEKGECELTLEGHSDRVNTVALTPDGRAVSASCDQTLKVWNLETGECVLTLEGHSGWVHAVAVTTEGHVVSGSSDKTLKVWNLETGECQRTLEGHPSSVEAVAVTPDGRAVSGAWDGTLKVWDLATGEVVATFTAGAGMCCCAVAADGRTIVAGDDAGNVHFLRLEGV